MRIKEVKANISAVIPCGNFANYRPSYEMVASIESGDNELEVLEYLREEINKKLKQDWTRLRDKDKVSYWKSIRWYDVEEGQMPSVTSVLGWSDFLYRLKYPEKFQFGGVSEEELEEYGARGHIVHHAVAHWFNTRKVKKIKDEKGKETEKVTEGEWKTSFPETKAEELLLKESKLKVEDCNWLGFMEKHGTDIEIENVEQAVYNHEDWYAGRLDIIGKWKGEPAVFDIKTTSNYTPRVELKYYKQLAAYAKASKGKIKHLVIIPLNPSNKCGFGTPKVAEYTDNLYEKFVKDLIQFTQDFKDFQV